MPRPTPGRLVAAFAVAAAAASLRSPALATGDWPAVYPQSFGAVGDGVHNDTDAVRAAVAHCAGFGGGGCDLVFANGTFLTGPFTVPGNNTRLFVDAGAVVRALPRVPWQQAGWTVSAVVTAAPGLRNVTIAGTGTIDGNGESWWAVTHDDKHYRPNMVVLSSVQGLRIEDVTLLNSPNHNIALGGCAGVRVRGITVLAPPVSPNTDGINFGGGSDQMISDSHISNGDDCVSVVTGGSAGPDDMAYGGNVVVRNMTCVNGHGISIGSIRHGTVTNVTVENVTFIDSENGARIKTYPNNSGLVSGVTYRDIVMRDVQTPILIDGKYCPKSQDPYPCPPGDQAVAIRNISFVGFRGTGSGLRGVVGRFDCSPLNPCAGITLQDVHLAASAVGAPNASFFCSNVSGPPAAPGDVEPRSCLQAPPVAL